MMDTFLLKWIIKEQEDAISLDLYHTCENGFKNCDMKKDGLLSLLI